MTTSELQNNPHTPDHTLTFIVEGKSYKTDQQYLNGAQIKALSGLPKEADLFLTISTPWQDEPIPDDKEVDLARPEIEKFYAKNLIVNISINDVEYKIVRGEHSATEIKKVGGVNPTHELDILKGGHQLSPLGDSEIVAVKGGEEFFSHVRDGSSS